MADVTGSQASDTPGPQQPGPGVGAGLSIAEVSRQLDVPIPTLRSWESRHDIPSLVRAPGKHRRYFGPDLHALRLMRDEVARGKRASLAAEDVRRTLGIGGPEAAHISAILQASERNDPAAVRAHLSEAHAALGLGPCLDGVLIPALRQVGSWWESGQCTIASEHLTTEAARVWVDKIAASIPPPDHPGTIVLACGPLDLHTVGLESLCLLLRRDGWNCRLLGTGTSIKSLGAAMKVSRARAVVIVSHLNSGRARAVQLLRMAHASGVEVFYAGNAFTSPRSRRNLPGSYLGTRLQAAAAMINDRLS